MAHAVRQTAAFRNATLGAVVALAVSTAGNGIPGAAAQEWKPDKPVEIVATNAPGGGSDRIGRILIKIIGGALKRASSWRGIARTQERF